MKVALYFFAFTVLFAVLIPQLIGTFLRQDDQVTRQLREGADPTVILEETASGKTVSSCLEARYEYRMTVNGIPYVRSLNDGYVAVLIDNKPKLFRLDESAEVATPVDNVNVQDTEGKKLLSLLTICVESGVSAEHSSLRLELN